MVLLLLLPGQWAMADIRGLPQISVLAASSLTNPLTEIVRRYSRQNNITVTASFDSTSNQARKIIDGESADIIISSHPKWMDKLKQMGLIDVYSRTNLVKNKLVLAISTSNRLVNHPVLKQDIVSQLTFLNDRLIMVMGDPIDTALGLHTKEAITQMGADENTKLWQQITPNIIPAGNAKNALYLISHGNNAGIIFYTDAYRNQQVTMLTNIPSRYHTPIIYQMAVVAGEHMSDARKFLAYLKSPSALATFEQHGFAVE